MRFNWPFMSVRKHREELADREVAIEVGKRIAQTEQLRRESFKELAKAHLIGENAKGTEAKLRLIRQLMDEVDALNKRIVKLQEEQK